MINLLAILVTSIIAILLCLAAAIFYGAWHWQKNDRRVQAQLLAARQANTSPVLYDAREIENLPAPLRRFFQQVLADGQPMVTTARVITKGQFSLGETRNNWRPFRANQLFIVRRPGFAWDARISMAPGVTAFVQDAYVTGAGVLHAEALGLITVADERDRPELAQGELLRHLGEMLWFPTALLPSQGVQWEAIDDSQARAFLADGNTSVWLDFHFGQDGLITSATTPLRYRTIKGVSKSETWYIQYRDYERREGMLIPLNSEVEWRLQDGPWPYWRGHVTGVAYEYGQ